MPKPSTKKPEKVMLTTFFQKKPKGEHISHKSDFGKVFGRSGRPFSKMDILKNVQNRFVKIRFEKKINFFILRIR
jgi:hypothetical protein